MLGGSHDAQSSFLAGHTCKVGSGVMSEWDDDISIGVMGCHDDVIMLW